MSELITIAAELEDKAARIRQIADDVAKLEAELVAFDNAEGDQPADPSPAAGGDAPATPAFDPATAATPVAASPQDPQPATATNVTPADGPLPSETSEPEPAADAGIDA